MVAKQSSSIGHEMLVVQQGGFLAYAAPARTLNLPLAFRLCGQYELLWRIETNANAPEEITLDQRKRGERWLLHPRKQRKSTTRRHQPHQQQSQKRKYGTTINDGKNGKNAGRTSIYNNEVCRRTCVKLKTTGTFQKPARPHPWQSHLENNQSC